jgi:hypothetical protein
VQVARRKNRKIVKIFYSFANKDLQDFSIKTYSIFHTKRASSLNYRDGSFLPPAELGFPALAVLF